LWMGINIGGVGEKSALHDATWLQCLPTYWVKR
jgi:hypothetical protein